MSAACIAVTAVPAAPLSRYATLAGKTRNRHAIILERTAQGLFTLIPTHIPPTHFPLPRCIAGYGFRRPRRIQDVCAPSLVTAAILELKVVEKKTEKWEDLRMKKVRAK